MRTFYLLLRRQVRLAQLETKPGHIQVDGIEPGPKLVGKTEADQCVLQMSINLLLNRAKKEKLPGFRWGRPCTTWPKLVQPRVNHDGHFPHSLVGFRSALVCEGHRVIIGGQVSKCLGRGVR